MNIDLAILSVIVFFASLVGTASGFGGAILIVALAVHLYSVQFLIPIAVLLNLALSLYLVARYHSRIDRRLLFGRMLPLTALGLPLGLILFNVVKSGALELALGAFVICLSIFELIALFLSERDAVRKPMSATQSALWLLASGVLEGMYASGGPLVVYCAGRNIPDKGAFRSTLAALWVLLSIVLVISHTATGKLTTESAWYFVVLLPALAAGAAIGEWLHDLLPERSFRIFVYSTLFVTGISIVI